MSIKVKRLIMGNTIAQMWSNRLKLLDRDRTFQVNCDRDEHTVILTFHQIPPSPTQNATINSHS